MCCGLTPACRQVITTRGMLPKPDLICLSYRWEVLKAPCLLLLLNMVSGQVPRLRTLLETGRKNGVDDLVWLDSAAAKALEPELRVAAALHSPSTGIVDSHRRDLKNTCLWVNRLCEGVQCNFRCPP